MRKRSVKRRKDYGQARVMTISVIVRIRLAGRQREKKRR